MWRRPGRAVFENKPSTRLSQGWCFGVKRQPKRPSVRAASNFFVSSDTCIGSLSGMTRIPIPEGLAAWSFLREPMNSRERWRSST